MIPLHGSDTSHTRRPRDLAHKTRTLGRTSTPRARSALLSPRKEYHGLRRARLGPPFIAPSSAFARYLFVEHEQVLHPLPFRREARCDDGTAGPQHATMTIPVPSCEGHNGRPSRSPEASGRSGPAYIRRGVARSPVAIEPVKRYHLCVLQQRVQRRRWRVQGTTARRASLEFRPARPESRSRRFEPGPGSASPGDPQILVEQSLELLDRTPSTDRAAAATWPARAGWWWTHGLPPAVREP